MLWWKDPVKDEDWLDEFFHYLVWMFEGYIADLNEYELATADL